MPPGRQELDIDARIRDALLRSIHYLGKRGFALLTGPLADLRYVTVGSARVGDVPRAVGPHPRPFWHGYIELNCSGYLSELVLMRHAESLATWEGTLDSELTSARADGNNGLVTAAQVLMRLTYEAGFRSGKTTPICECIGLTRR